MRKKLLVTLLVLVSMLCLVSCRVETPTPTPTEKTPEVKEGYNIVFYTFNKTKDPSTLKNQTSIPSDLPVLSVTGYEFGGWYYDVNFETQAQAGDKVEKNVTLYAKLTAVSEGNTPEETPDTPTQDGGSTTPDTPTQDGGSTTPDTPVESSIKKILDEAATLAQGSSLSGNRTATGTIKEIDEPYTEQYKNISVVIEDGVAEILIHRAKGEVSTLKVGDKISVTGEIKNYNGTIEFVNSTITLISSSTGGSTTPDNPSQGGGSTTPETPVVNALKDVVFQSVEETYVKDKTYSITATNIPSGLTVEYVGNNVTGAGNHLVTANFYDAEHNLVGSLYAYIKVVYQVEFPEI